MHDQNNPEERDVYNNKERKRNKKLRRGDSNPLVSANYFAKNDISKPKTLEIHERHLATPLQILFSM